MQIHRLLTVTKKFILPIIITAACIALWWQNRDDSQPPTLSEADLITAARSQQLTAYSAQPPAVDACKAALGRDLFFDQQLSRDGNVACASCHVPELSFTDGKPLGAALGTTDRNTPTLINMRDSFWFFWDGRADSLAAQMLGPLENDAEHGFSRTQLAQQILTNHRAKYESCFGKITSPAKLPAGDLRLFPSPPPINMSQAIAAYALATQKTAGALAQLLLAAKQQNLPPWQYMADLLVAPYNAPAVESSCETASFKCLDQPTQKFINQVSANVGLALAAFQNTIVTERAPFDHFVARLRTKSTDDAVASAFASDFGADEWAGYKIFAGRGQCVTCHQGPTFSDQQFHNIGLAANSEVLAAGRAAGLRRALLDPFNCLGGVLPRTESESCRELPYLDVDNIENLGAFKTPTLRNLATTAPYMHDGRFATLDDVLQHYNELAAEPAIGHREETLKPMQLAPHELLQLKKFLLSLNAKVDWFRRE